MVVFDLFADLKGQVDRSWRQRVGASIRLPSRSIAR
jgi:hypothetical protein